MHIRVFVQQNQDNWNEYRELLTKAVRSGPAKMTTDEIDRFIWLYRELTNNLARARALYPGSETEQDLNSLAAQGYDILYHHGKIRTSRFRSFFSYVFPQSMKKNIAFVAASLAITFLFCVAGIFMHRIDPRLPSAVVPQKLMDHFKSELDEKGRVDRDISFEDRSLFSSQLIINNVRVSFMAFALGVAFGVGTIYILAVNGLMMGCLGLIFYERGQLINYLAFILPHGVVEIGAIIISGAAGLRIGYSILNPGELTRGESIKIGAAEAIELEFGVMGMLVLAGLLEAFFTPIQWIPDLAKVIFSGGLFLLMVYYFARAFRSNDTQQKTIMTDAYS